MTTSANSHNSSDPRPSDKTGSDPGNEAEKKNKEAQEQIEDLQEDADKEKELAGGSPGDSPNPAEPMDQPDKPPR